MRKEKKKERKLEIKKLSLLDDISIYRKILRNLFKKPIRISELSKVAGYKFNIQKLICLYVIATND